jgi:hypothetical protein
MNKKTISYCTITLSIILILSGGYLSINYGNSYGLMLVGGILLLILRGRN